MCLHGTASHSLRISQLSNIVAQPMFRNTHRVILGGAPENKIASDKRMLANIFPAAILSSFYHLSGPAETSDCYSKSYAKERENLY